MCGIFGYVGKNNDASQIVLGGLKKLEYRGYDSWGIAVSSSKAKGQNLIVEKRVGKIGEGELKPQIIDIRSNSALGHTRWATHGGVTEANAHPHIDCAGEVALVHNGIVENFQELRKKLSKGHKIKSQTDTEIVVHMLEEASVRGETIDILREIFLKLSGLNALVFLDRSGEIYFAKSGTPLVVGLSKDGNFIASDPDAISSHTQRMVFVEDGQIGRISAKGVEIFDAKSRKQVKMKVADIKWRSFEAEKGDYAHFMIKEISEQPNVLSAIAANGKKIGEIANIIKEAKGTFFIGCGSASYASLAGTYLFSKIAKSHVNFAVGSEFGYLEDYLNKNSLVVAISQSGETIDVVQPVSRAKKKGAKIVALTNVLGSTLFRISDQQILLNAGVERAVCATKSYSAMVANLIFIAYAMVGKLEEGRKIIQKASVGASKILIKSHVEKIKKLAKRLAKSRDIYIIGRGLSYPTALEATLKLKEVSYLHSEGFAGGELKHGVIALVEEGTPCIVFAPNDETREEIISNAIEIKARGGYIIGISQKNNEAFDFWLPVSDCGVGSLILDPIPVQLLAYYVAIYRGFDPDRPRNLAKSVTVK